MTVILLSKKVPDKKNLKNLTKGLSKKVVIKVPKKQLKAYKKAIKRAGFKGKVRKK